MSGSNPTPPSAGGPPPLEAGAWILDPERSEVSFVARSFWGVLAVRGRFSRYAGRLDLSGTPAIELTIEAASLDTGNVKRDEHLRSADFFDVTAHPQARFSASDVHLHGDHLHVTGQLEAGSGAIALEPGAHFHGVEDGYEIEAFARANMRRLGMSSGPGAMIRPTVALSVRGRLIRAD